MTSTTGVVVTGASRGIGEACAFTLAKHGYQVFAGVRRVEDGEALRHKAPDHLIPVQLDITDPRQLAAAVEQIGQALGSSGLFGLVNNAGVSIPAPLEFIPLDAFRTQLEVNVTAQLAVTQAFLPLIRQAKGRIVNMSSVGAHMVQPYVGAYHVSKFALEGMTQVFRAELAPFGIQVIAIEPSMIATPMWTTAAATATSLLSHMPPEADRYYGTGITQALASAAQVAQSGLSPDRVAQAVYRALTDARPRTTYTVP